MIPLFKVYISKNAINNVARVLDSGFTGEGPEVKLFEKDLKKFFNLYKKKLNIVLVNSGTSAEHLIYHILKKGHIFENFNWKKISKNEEVISSPLTSQATNWPILLNGLKIKWADIDKKTLNISLKDVEKKINEKTRIISIVHFAGNPVDIFKLKKIVNKAERKYKKKIIIIEDCAHSFGSVHRNGELVGCSGNISTFSLQSIKHVTSIDGGFFLTNSLSLEQRAKRLRWYGIDRDKKHIAKDFRFYDDILEEGFKFHMNDVLASIGRANLKEANKILRRYKLNGSFYDNNLKDISGIKTIKKIGYSSYWLYPLLVEDKNNFISAMKSRGVQCSSVHKRNDSYSCVKKYREKLINMDYVENRMVCIPVGFWVKNKERDYIIKSIKKGW